MNEIWNRFSEIVFNICIAQKKTDESLKSTIKVTIREIIEADKSLTSELVKKKALEIYVEQIVIANRYLSFFIYALSYFLFIKV